MASQNDEIRELFIDGVNEVFTTLFNDGETEGVLFYPQEDIVTDTYGENRDKKFATPKLLTARVQLNMSQEDGETKMIKGTATITVPLKSLLGREIDVSEGNYFNLRQGLLRYKDKFFEIQNISPTAFVEQVFLLYNFTCREIMDLTHYIIPPDEEPEEENLEEEVIDG